MNVFWTQFFWFLGGIIVGAVAGFFIARYFLQKELEKNPPLNETVIREMMSQMGRTPSQKQVQAVLRASENEQKKNKKK